MGYSESEEFNTENFSEENGAEKFEYEPSEVNKNEDFLKEIKTYFRLARRYFSLKVREKLQKNFTNIVYLTLDCPEYTPNSERNDSPFEYITKMRKQHPENDIRILLPIIGLNRDDFKPTKKISLNVGNDTLYLEKTAIEFKFFLQNRTTNAAVYKFKQNDLHIDVYAIYSPSFSYCKNISEISKLQYLAPFTKSARISIKKLAKDKFAPDIVHCENIPFFLGCEFEKIPFYGVKILQIIKDFTQIDLNKSEPFWAAINLADKFAMTRICSDAAIKKHIASLFNINTTQPFTQMKDCLKYIYKNYQKFRRYIDKGAEIDENILFNKLNERTLELFPQMQCGKSQSYNIMLSSIKKADFWATISKTYYKEIFANQNLSGSLFPEISKTKDKSKCLSFGCNKSEMLENNKIYKDFNSENFRELRGQNKKILLKELGLDCLKTRFTDSSLFKNNNYEIKGYLDSFYDAPLFFVQTSSEIFANGVDILFNTILKMFELHKNIQVIIVIKDGLKNNFINSWVNFLIQNKYLNGRWVFIDGEIKPAKFYASSDMTLIPRRINMATPEHYIAMGYGCVPVVSRCGILNDTIADIFEDITNGCGFKTKSTLMAEGDVNEIFINTVTKALNLYQNNPYSWNLLIKNCLLYDSSWSFDILDEYNQIYDDLM